MLKFLLPYLFFCGCLYIRGLVWIYNIDDYHTEHLLKGYNKLVVSTNKRFGTTIKYTESLKKREVVTVSANGPVL